METVPTDGQTTHPWLPGVTTTRITKMRERRDKEIISTPSFTNLAWERNISASILRMKDKRQQPLMVQHLSSSGISQYQVVHWTKRRKCLL